MDKSLFEQIKREFSNKHIDEIRRISEDHGQSYSPEAVLAAKELLIERDPSFDKMDRILFLQQKNENSIGDIEKKVGCLYQFLIVQVVLIVIGFILGLLQARGR